MSTALFVIRIIGLALAAILAVVMVVFLLALLVPIGYKGRFSVTDPEARDEPHWEVLKDRSSIELACTWFGPLCRVAVTWPDEPFIDIRIAWMHIHPLGRHRDKETAGDEGGTRKAPQGGIYDKIVGVYRKIDYYRRVLHKEETSYTLARLREMLARILRWMLPQKWNVHGIVGLGDPAATARVLEVQGILYPFTAGHLYIEPIFEQYQMDVNGMLQGRIRLLHLLTAAVSILMDRKVRMTLGRIRNADRNIAAHYHRPVRAVQEPEA